MLNSGVSASRVNEEGLLTRVFQQREEVKQFLDGIVSSMMEGEKMKGC
jgi:hypothetical protein